MDVNVGPCSFFSNSKVFSGGMNSYRTDSSTISTVKYLFFLCEIVIDRVGDSCCKNDCVTVQNLYVESFVAVETK